MDENVSMTHLYHLGGGGGGGQLSVFVTLLTQQK